MMNALCLEQVHVSDLHTYAGRAGATEIHNTALVRAGSGHSSASVGGPSVCALVGMSTSSPSARLRCLPSRRHRW